MWILFILIPVSLILGGMGLVAFYWALKSDQFSDLDGNAYRILIDKEPLEDPPALPRTSRKDDPPPGAT